MPTVHIHLDLDDRQALNLLAAFINNKSGIEVTVDLNDDDDGDDDDIVVTDLPVPTNDDFMRRECPRCHAMPGNQCINTSTGRSYTDGYIHHGRKVPS